MKRFKVQAAVIIAAVAAVLFLWAFWWMGLRQAEEGSSGFDLPSFTMTFVFTQGQAVSVGDELVDPRQMLRLEYTDKDHWVETVIEAANIDTRVGTFSNVGSYQRVDGDKYTTFGAVTGATDTETIGADMPDLPPGVPADVERRKLPGIYLIPFDVKAAENGEYEEYGIIAHGPTRTNARVCFKDWCEDNHKGLSYTMESGVLWIYANDARGIPLKVGDSFEVCEVTVHSDRHPILPDSAKGPSIYLTPATHTGRIDADLAPLCPATQSSPP